VAGSAEEGKAGGVAPAPEGGAGEPLTSDVAGQLGGRAARGALWAGAAQAVALIARLAGLAVLARWLEPAAFGVVAMALVVVGGLGVFRDLGLSAVTVQRAERQPAQVSALFWVNLCAGVGLAGLTWWVAPPVGRFFGEPELPGLLGALGLGFVLSGATVQHQAMLQRKLRLGTLAAVEACGALGGVAAAIASALAGAGAWALVVQSLVDAGLVGVGCWSTSGFRPGRPRRGLGLRADLRFGGQLTGYRVFNFVARNADDLLIGRVYGSATLGLYNRAYALLTLPLRLLHGPLSGAALSALSRLQGQPARYRRAYLRLLQKIALVAMPLAAVMAVSTDWLVALVLGPHFGEAAELFRLLAPAALVQPVSAAMGWLFVTQGRGREQLRAGALGSGLALAAIVVGLPFGPAGVAASYAAVTVTVRAPLLWWLAGRRGPVSTSDILSCLVLPATLTLGVLASSLVLRLALPDLSPGPGLVLVGLAAAGVSGGALALLPAGRRAVQDLAALLTAAFDWKGATR